MKKTVVKVVITSTCVMTLMFGSGYVGARFALANLEEAAIHSVPLSETQAGSDIGVSLLASFPTEYESFTLPELFNTANPSVVAISTEIVGRNAFGMQVMRPSSGSGFLISDNGYIVTNDHVIEGASNITVLMYDGREFPASIIGRDPSTDLAVIKIIGESFPFLDFGNSDYLRVGDQVAAIGNPLGQLANSMTVGYVSALSRDVNIDGVSHTKIQTDAAVNLGNSGGPLLNLYGDVVGVVSAKSVGMNVEGLGFAIPSSHAEDIVANLIQYGYVRGRAVLGVTIQY
ncbi:MAG: trypsin-like peptidase domain-containing protein, partial [Defluviitaleaceae bacterium]|nr:trypsin-like peptidase domain-containing protein [Defluviitaleaceae bacterium]